VCSGQADVTTAQAEKMETVVLEQKGGKQWPDLKTLFDGMQLRHRLVQEEIAEHVRRPEHKQAIGPHALAFRRARQLATGSSRGVGRFRLYDFQFPGDTPYGVLQPNGDFERVG
jgi:hypothetical protein